MSSRQENIDEAIKSFVEDNADFYKDQHGTSKYTLRKIAKKMFESIGFVSKTGILDHIDSNMELMEDDVDSEDYSGAFKYESMATSLVELLEVNNCGSVGGFDKGQEDTSLEGRIKWLKGER